MNSKVRTQNEVNEIKVSEDAGVVQKVDKNNEAEKETAEQEKQVHVAYKIFWSSFSIMQVFLFLRFILQFLEANPESLFYSFIIIVTTPFLFPFDSLFTDYNIVLGEEINTLFAMFAYLMLAVVGMQIINLFHPVEREI